MERMESELKRAAADLDLVRSEIARVLVGQRGLVDRMLVALLSDGHLLVEGLPGLAKTTAIRALASTLHMSFARVQFTPDLLPADLVGGQVYNPREGSFSTRRGPIFANIVLADEINRAPAKVQSALLEAMQERQVTLADASHPLPKPFLVLATQNPIEQEGTYPLPEAQVDRFMMKLSVGYPSKDEEREILERASHPPVQPAAVLTPERLVELQALAASITMKPVLADYVVRLVHATRQPGSISPKLGRYVQVGASPRATIALAAAARSLALLDGRDFATPDDVKDAAVDVLRHRILLAYEAEADQVTPDTVVREILAGVKTP